MSSSAEKLAMTAVASMIAGCSEAPPPPASAPVADPVVEIPATSADAGPPAESDPEDKRAWKPFKKPKSGSNCCKGYNECKGQGNCKMEDMHDCKGMNECKGKGGCKPMECVGE
jgi:hypothetical protein